MTRRKAICDDFKQKPEKRVRKVSTKSVLKKQIHEIVPMLIEFTQATREILNTIESAVNLIQTCTSEVEAKKKRKKVIRKEIKTQNRSSSSPKHERNPGHLDSTFDLGRKDDNTGAA